MSLIATTQTWWKLFEYHLLGRRTCKVFDVYISSQANELFNLLGVSPDGCHVKGRLPSFIPLVDLVLLSGWGAAGDFLLHRGGLRGVTGRGVCERAEREVFNWCSQLKSLHGQKHWIEQSHWNSFFREKLWKTVFGGRWEFLYHICCVFGSIFRVATQAADCDQLVSFKEGFWRRCDEF